MLAFGKRVAWGSLALCGFAGSPGCFLTAQGGRSFDLMWLAFGVALLILGLRFLMTRSQAPARPPWRRFLEGLWIAICLGLG